MPAQKIPLATALAAGLGNGHNSDESGENLQINLGVETSTGKIGLDFSHPVLKVRMPRDRARALAQGILAILDASNAIATVHELPSKKG